MNEVWANAPWVALAMFVIWKLGEKALDLMKAKNQSKSKATTEQNKSDQVSELTDVIKDFSESQTNITSEKMDKILEHMTDLAVAIKQICVVVDKLYNSTESMHQRIDKINEKSLKEIYQRLTKIESKIEEYMKDKG